MKSILIASALAMVFGAFLFGQSPVTSQPATPDPSFFIAAGTTYNGTAIPKVSGWVSAAFEALPGLYSITTVDNTLKSSSIRTGMAKKIIERHKLIFLIHADAGVTTTTLGGTTNALGSFSGGPMLAYKLPKLKNIYAIGVMRFVAVTSTSAKPIWEFGFGWGL